ncbi:hypothetical protein D1872_290080 [compost metagenome]
MGFKKSHDLLNFTRPNIMRWIYLQQILSKAAHDFYITSFRQVGKLLHGILKIILMIQIDPD